jgi:hypothetical protein
VNLERAIVVYEAAGNRMTPVGSGTGRIRDRDLTHMWIWDAPRIGSVRCQVRRIGDESSKGSMCKGV